ncbi:MAG: hypothetical protein MZV64_28725 [Ignavibacteriales bacterium]|nr:hypothetical protein [Ignavibacteriales bacterium]
MVRKTSFAILALAVLITGVIAFRKLNYWESSIWIFKLNSGQLTEEEPGMVRVMAEAMAGSGIKEGRKGLKEMKVSKDRGKESKGYL